MRVGMLIAAVLFAGGLVRAQETSGVEEPPVFSGPQPGEPLPGFAVRGVYDDDAGKQLDFVAAADGGPIVLIFLHQVTRPSVGFVRLLTKYAASRAEDGLTTGFVFLDDDPTEAEATLLRVRHALTPGVATGVYEQGAEGPGAYGLNRDVALTILVGNENKTTANFALVQPSVQADLPKVAEAIVALIGGEPPSLEELGGREAMAMRRKTADQGPSPELRELLRPLIQKNASEEEVDAAAAALEEFLAERPDERAVVGRITTNIISAGRLEAYGTPRAQEFLKKWAAEFGPAPRGDASEGDDASDEANKDDAKQENAD